MPGCTAVEDAAPALAGPRIETDRALAGLFRDDRPMIEGVPVPLTASDDSPRTFLCETVHHGLNFREALPLRFDPRDAADLDRNVVLHLQSPKHGGEVVLREAAIVSYHFEADPSYSRQGLNGQIE
jgi:hypothetical protein